MRVLATHSIRQFPLHFPSCASRVPPGSERALITQKSAVLRQNSLLLVFCVVKSSKSMLECFYFHTVGCRVAFCCAGRRCFVAMFEVSTVLMLLILFFWDVTLCSGADGSWHIKEFFILLFRPTNAHTIYQQYSLYRTVLQHVSVYVHHPHAVCSHIHYSHNISTVTGSINLVD